ncbi:TetR/AcrR family transcriptional regulator [Actinophytocola sp.]|uniref:TetR/AcrR family transcriptional regulator n=1 Tax=Actinophytocola sp. TaxID=1872138 RepID=UPI00389A36AE
MAAAPPPARRPGRPPSLTRDDVARAALEEGVTQLSMPVVARRLGVGHSTLYRYVHDRDDLLLAALDLALREFTWPPAEQDWRELLMSFADAVWRFLERYPGMAEATQVVPALPARALDIADEYVSRLRGAGLSRREALTAVSFVVELTVAAEISGRRMNRVFETPRGRRSLQELFGEALSGDPASRRGWLHEKLAIMVDGLANRLGECGTTVLPQVAGPVRSTVPPARGEIGEAGRRIARKSGLAAVSVHAVANELDVDTAAVRQVVGDRDGVVVAMLDAVAGDVVIAVPPPVPEPRTELLAVATAGYLALSADPWAVVALAVDHLASPAIMSVAERVFTAFRAAGVPQESLGHANRILWGHVYGAVLNQSPPDTFARRVATSANLPAPTGPARSTLGIEIVVDGLLAHLAT